MLIPSIWFDTPFREDNEEFTKQILRDFRIFAGAVLGVGASAPMNARSSQRTAGVVAIMRDALRREHIECMTKIAPTLRALCFAAVS